MRKYAGIPADKTPDVFYALPELHYAQQLNGVRVLLENALEQGWASRTAYFHEGISISYGEVRTEVHRYGRIFRRLGLRLGDRVLIRLQDGPELIYAVLAVQALGGIAVPTYVQLRSQDLAVRAEDCAPVLTIVSSDLLDECGSAIDEGAQLGQVVVLRGEPSGRFTSFDSLEQPNGDDFVYADTHRDDVCLILYTSGSTGRPKGACHSHADMLAVCDTYCRYCVELRLDDVIAGPPAIPFALGFGFFILFPLRFGASAILESRKSPAALVQRAVQHGASILVGVATYYNRLGSYLADNRVTLPRLRMALCGGEPLPLEIDRAWMEATGVRLEQFLGTTELLHDVIAIRHGRDDPGRHAIGRAVPGYEVSVRDPETFTPLEHGSHGLLCIRGATGTRYYNRPEAQESAVRDGWNVFQDIVFSDPDGYIHYVARHDEMIVTGGHSISPVEVEQVLLRHPAVLECACVGAADPLGQRPQIVKAYVVLAHGHVRSEQLGTAIKDFFKENAAPYKYPREIEFLDILPRTLNGKIMRSELRAKKNP